MKQNHKQELTINLSDVRRFDWISRYIRVCINFYGLVKISDVVDIFNHYETKNKLELDEFVERLEMIKLFPSFKDLRTLDNKYLYTNKVFFDFVDEEIMIKALLIYVADERGKLKPYLPPKKNTFFKYAKSHFVSMQDTDGRRGLNEFNKFIREFFHQHTKGIELESETILMLQGIRGLAELKDLKKLVKELRGKIEDVEDAEQFNALADIATENLYNNTRSILLYGHTPNEIAKRKLN